MKFLESAHPNCWVVFIVVTSLFRDDRSRHPLTVWHRLGCHNPWTDSIEFLNTIPLSWFHPTALMRNPRLTKLNWKTPRSTASRKDPFWAWSTNTILQSCPSLIVQLKVLSLASAQSSISIPKVTIKRTGRRLMVISSVTSKSPTSTVNSKSLTIPRRCRVVLVRPDLWTSKVLKLPLVSAVKCTKSRTHRLQPTSRDHGYTQRTQQSRPCSEARLTKLWNRITSFLYHWAMGKEPNSRWVMRLVSTGTRETSPSSTIKSSRENEQQIPNKGNHYRCNFQRNSMDLFFKG